MGDTSKGSTIFEQKYEKEFNPAWYGEKPLLGPKRMEGREETARMSQLEHTYITTLL
jgi:hypothetical protein